MTSNGRVATRVVLQALTGCDAAFVLNAARRSRLSRVVPSRSRLAPLTIQTSSDRQFSSIRLTNWLSLMEFVRFRCDRMARSRKRKLSRIRSSPFNIPTTTQLVGRPETTDDGGCASQTCAAPVLAGGCAAVAGDLSRQYRGTDDRRLYRGAAGGLGIRRRRCRGVS